MTGQSLSNTDTILLRLEDPTNLMMVTGIMIFGTALDYEDLKAVVRARLLQIDRFRQRAVWPKLGPGNPTWEDDPDLDLDYHLQRITLPPPGDQAALQEVVSLLASTPLDLSRSPWQGHLIEGCCQGCALVLRLHHSIGDGMAMAHAVFSMTDTDPDSPLPFVTPQHPNQEEEQRPGARFRSLRARGKARRRAAGALARKGLHALAYPARTINLARDTASVVNRFLMFEPDPKTAFRGKLGVSKRAAWSETVPLDDVQAIRRGLGGTVNDVLLAAMTGAMRRYLEGRGEAVDGLSFHAFVPVNLRPPGSEIEMGNRMGAVYLPLPVSIAEPADRLRVLQERMNDRKDSEQANAFYFLLNILGKAPTGVANSLFNTFGNRGTVVMTNVQGPRENRYLAGSPLETLMFWVPKTGRLGIGVSILSYAGEVRLGIITDEGLVPDPETMIAGFHAEFESLMALAQEAENRP